MLLYHYCTVNLIPRVGFVVKYMAMDALPAIVDGNYIASSQPGCHIAHYDADWVIEASDFDLDDYGLEAGQEDSIPDMVIDPESKSLR